MLFLSGAIGRTGAAAGSVGRYRKTRAAQRSFIRTISPLARPGRAKAS
jgi:hypothetical protein